MPQPVWPKQISTCRPLSARRFLRRGWSLSARLPGRVADAWRPNSARDSPRRESALPSAMDGRLFLTPPGTRERWPTRGGTRPRRTGRPSEPTPKKRTPSARGRASGGAVRGLLSFLRSSLRRREGTRGRRLSLGRRAAADNQGLFEGGEGETVGARARWSRVRSVGRGRAAHRQCCVRHVLGPRFRGGASRLGQRQPGGFLGKGEMASSAAGLGGRKPSARCHFATPR